jgi:hypothetical protein
MTEKSAKKAVSDVTSQKASSAPVAEAPVEVTVEPVATPVRLLPSPSGKFLLPAAIVAVVAIAAVPGYYYYAQYRTTQEMLRNPAQAAQRELDEVMGKVKTHIAVPDERPTLATVSDVGKLQSQPFFANAANGDKVLIFANAKKAVLYRPEADLVIEVAPLTISQQQVAGAATGTAEATLVQATPTGIAGNTRPTKAPVQLKVAIYNGTSKTGLAGTIEQIVNLKIPTLQIVKKENAKKQTYEKSIVVDIKGNARSAAEQIASIIGGEVSSLPPGETLPDADFLIIAGQK